MRVPFADRKSVNTICARSEKLTSACNRETESSAIGTSQVLSLPMMYLGSPAIETLRKIAFLQINAGWDPAKKWIFDYT